MSVCQVFSIRLMCSGFSFCYLIRDLGIWNFLGVSYLLNTHWRIILFSILIGCFTFSLKEFVKLHICLKPLAEHTSSQFVWRHVTEDRMHGDSKNFRNMFNWTIWINMQYTFLPRIFVTVMKYFIHIKIIIPFLILQSACKVKCCPQLNVLALAPIY